LEIVERSCAEMGSAAALGREAGGKSGTRRHAARASSPHRKQRSNLDVAGRVTHKRVRRRLGDVGADARRLERLASIRVVAGREIIVQPM
jgi:hypothetical protein